VHKLITIKFSEETDFKELQPLLVVLSQFIFHSINLLKTVNKTKLNMDFASSNLNILKLPSNKDLKNPVMFTF